MSDRDGLDKTEGKTRWCSWRNMQDKVIGENRIMVRGCVGGVRYDRTERRGIIGYYKVQGVAMCVWGY